MAINQKFSIMCEDVRQEITGKFILLGVYTPDITLSQVPANIPLAFFQGYECDRPANLTIRVRLERMDTGAPVMEAMGMLQVKKPGLVPMVLKFMVPIPAFGTYALTVKIEGEESPFISTFEVQLPVQQQGPTQFPPQSMGFR